MGILDLLCNLDFITPARSILDSNTVTFTLPVPKPEQVAVTWTVD
jgi:hypothetical protein